MVRNIKYCLPINTLDYLLHYCYGNIQHLLKYKIGQDFFSSNVGTKFATTLFDFPTSFDRLIHAEYIIVCIIHIHHP